MSAANSGQLVVELLREHRTALHALGDRRVALFGSFARNQASTDSNVDLRVEFEPGQTNFDTWLALA